MREKILKNKIGIFQGRLTDSKILQNYPSDWKQEIFLSRSLGFSHIEFFLEEEVSLTNPFWKKSERLNLKKLFTRYSKSKKFLLCDNYLIKNNLYNKNTKLYLKKLFRKLLTFKYPKLILPLHGKYFQNIDKLVNYFNELFQVKSKKIEISFEIDTNLKDVSKFFNLLKSNNCGITFDTGNMFLRHKSLSKIYQDLKLYVNHIHIKDRNYVGQNVALGTGLVNFKEFFDLIKKENYNETITLETFRRDNAVIQAVKNNIFLDKYL